jgi:hypothetical protein
MRSPRRKILINTTKIGVKKCKAVAVARGRIIEPEKKSERGKGLKRCPQNVPANLSVRNIARPERYIHGRKTTQRSPLGKRQSPKSTYPPPTSLPAKIKGS